mgnify:CR=1 FL=1
MKKNRQVKRWDVWTADVEYEDAPGIVKNRPVLILDDEQSIALVAKITSHEPRDGFEGEYAIAFWKLAGLEKKSTVRLSQRFRYKDTDLDSKLGELHPYDIMQIQRMLSSM